MLDFLVIPHLPVTAQNTLPFLKSAPTLNKKVLKHPEQNLSLYNFFLPIVRHERLGQ